MVQFLYGMEGVKSDSGLALWCKLSSRRSSLVPVVGLVQGYFTGYCAELCGSLLV